MSLDHILLGLLREPASGYDLKATFQAGCQHFWSAELGQIYPTLARLEERGWLNSHREPSARGPARRVYRRTAAGSRELHRWLRGGAVTGTERFAYVAQLLFLGELADPPATIRFLEDLRVKLLAVLELLQVVEADLKAKHPDCPHDLTDADLHDYLSLRLGTGSLRAKVAVCDEGLALLRARAPKETSDE